MNIFTLVNHQLKFLLSYLVNEILENNFEILVRSNSILEHRKTKLTEKKFNQNLRGVQKYLSKRHLCYFEMFEIIYIVSFIQNRNIVLSI